MLLVWYQMSYERIMTQAQPQETLTPRKTQLKDGNASLLTTAQTKHQVQRRLFLDVVVAERTPV